VSPRIVSGNQIRAARGLADISQAELAAAAGVDPRSVRYWEAKGDRCPTMISVSLASIERAFKRYGVEFIGGNRPGVVSMTCVERA
jgi:transcriptional regulator with XRE-family HTH domain